MPGAFPGILPVWIIIMIAITIIATLLAIAFIVVLCHLIDASTGSSEKNWTDPATGDTWSLACTQTLLGGSNCTQCDLTAGKCPDGAGPSTGGLTDSIVPIVEAGIVVGVAALAIYLVYKGVSKPRSA
jgi:hypothetical protein